jgi:AcrR family transcriptional regulator
MAELEAVTPEEESTKKRILDAAMQCFERIGIAKTSLLDVARVAGLSRGTVYRYFGDRQTLVDAVIDVGTQQNFAAIAAAMAKKTTLAKQMGAYAEAAVRTAMEHRSYEHLMDEDATLLRRIVGSSEESFRRAIEFLEPYIVAAKKRGEVANSTPVTEAAEWLTRIIMTLSSTPASASFDVNNPRSVGRFVERFAVRGL